MWHLLVVGVVGTAILASHFQTKKKHYRTLGDHENTETCDCLHDKGKKRKKKKRKNVFFMKKMYSKNNYNASKHVKFPGLQGHIVLSYGVGMGVMLSMCFTRSEQEKKVKEAEALVQELKRLIDERMFESGAYKNLNGGKDAILFIEGKKSETSGNLLEEDNRSLRGAITTIAAPERVTEVPENEAELEHIRAGIFNGDLIHKRRVSYWSDSSDDSADVADGEISLDGILDKRSSEGQTYSENPLHFSQGDDEHGVSPYELDRRLHVLFEKQQEARISKLETELKSTETRLTAKERELQQWKEHLRHLTEISFCATSGENSMGHETHGFVDIMGRDSNNSTKSDYHSEQEVSSKGIFPFNRLGKELESTADCQEQHCGKILPSQYYAISSNSNCTKGMVSLFPDCQDSIDGSSTEFVSLVPGNSLS